MSFLYLLLSPTGGGSQLYWKYGYLFRMTTWDVMCVAMHGGYVLVEWKHDLGLKYAGFVIT